MMRLFLKMGTGTDFLGWEGGSHELNFVHVETEMPGSIRVEIYGSVWRLEEMSDGVKDPSHI